MKKLRAADSADAIVDGLGWRRAEVFVPSSLRPLSVLDLALPRRIKRIVQRTFRSDPIAQEFDPAARADDQEATRRPLPELVAEALTNDETAERRVISLATANTHVSRILLKLHARGRAQLVVITYESGLVKPRPAAHGQRTRCSQPMRKQASGRASTRHSKWTTSSSAGPRPAGYCSVCDCERVCPTGDIIAAVRGRQLRRPEVRSSRE
jgi:hypothetical protein